MLTTSEKIGSFKYQAVVTLPLRNLVFCHVNPQKLVNSAVTSTMRCKYQKSHINASRILDFSLACTLRTNMEHSTLSNWRTGNLKNQRWKGYYVTKTSDCCNQPWYLLEFFKSQQKLNKLLDIIGVIFLWDSNHLHPAYCILYYILWPLYYCVLFY